MTICPICKIALSDNKSLNKSHLMTHDISTLAYAIIKLQEDYEELRREYIYEST